MRHPRALPLLPLLLLPLALVHCGDPDALLPEPTADAGHADAGHDAGGQQTSDAGQGSPGGPDGGSGPDSGVPPDAGELRLMERSWPSGDVDQDGIPDALEDWLTERYAPEVRLSPEDTALPANVDWYLARVHMRFDHPGCPDHEILKLGTVTQANLSEQSHKRTNSYCIHQDAQLIYSRDSHKDFFLQPPDDAVHRGAPQSEWRVYVHAKKSYALTDGFDIQYWFWFPYNDTSVLNVNHEADWEHITVVVDAYGVFQSAWYAQHGHGKLYSRQDLTFVQQTHPVVYTAKGTHASYPRVGKYDTEAPGVHDYTHDGGPVWQTWTSWVNVGEKASPRNGQHFIKYGGRWGEVGEFEMTSGPQGPSFQGAWNKL
jgi:hypothetical protein